ncbi:MAG TPA: signal peptidase I [Actinomycetota bacterium]|nr:signal peptidase I [Actinomycetota bacterium]
MRLGRRALVAAGAAVATAALLRASGAFRFEVRGASMRPTLEPGDWLLAIRSGRPRRGDIVVVRHPGGGPEVVKRVVGLPGERVSTDGRTVWVDGRPATEPYARGAGPPGEWRLGPAEVVVLGDARGLSTDSRSFGPVPLSAVEGRAVLRYWPRPGLLWGGAALTGP